MKKNNKYRNNSNNNFIYSLNYKFDSNSPAGKICGTALELIKKYNDLAKDSLNNNDYVEAEVYRQYAEHYRKIVTEINDKKAQRFSERRDNSCPSPANEAEPQVQDNDKPIESDVSEVEQNTTEVPPQETVAPKKQFTVIEISSSETQKLEEKVSKPRGRRPKKDVAAV